MPQQKTLPASKKPGISQLLLFLLSFSTAVTVANLYYAQPLLENLPHYFRVSSAVIGTAAMLMQIGYALGLLFLVPLGDIKERRALIMTMLFCSIAALLGISFAPIAGWLMVCSVLVGLTSVTPMLIVTLAAHLAEPAKRGKVIALSVHILGSKRADLYK